MFENMNTLVAGHLIIKDFDTNEILVDKDNAIHYDNFSLALAKSLAHKPDGNIHTMWFGNGGATVSGSGQITYLPPRVSGSGADLYNPTYYKVVDDLSPLNTDPTNNYMTITHTTGSLYSDINIVCVLDFGEPASQSAFDDATDMEGNYVFDEIGFKTFNSTPANGTLITHVIFSPVQKAMNRRIKIEYTIRISAV
jgi:hypothetical protein